MKHKWVFSAVLLCMVFLIASCTFDNPFLQAFVRGASSSAVSPSTPLPGNVTERIRFAAGAASAQLTGQVSGTSVHTYLLEARAGQRMQARVASPYNNVFLTIVSPGGSPLARAQAGAQSFDSTLPETGDYTLQVSSPVGTAVTTYLLNVSVTNVQPTATPQPGYLRIRFAPGTTSTQVSGQVSGALLAGYVLEARAGQRMQLVLASPLGNVFLTVISPSGIPLARAQNGVQSFDQILPESGDYILQISAPVGTAVTTFLLNASVTGGQATITPTSQPGYQRIRFAPGTTSIMLNGQINSGSVVGYLLEARAGQRMTLSLTSPGGNVYLTVLSPSGGRLLSAELGEQTLDRDLSETGDYTLLVTTFAGTPQTSYTLNVSVVGAQPPQPPPPSYQRIRFASGATSAAVTGQVNGNNIVGYLLEARAGQRMQISVTSPAGNVYLTVVSPGGSPLARAQNGVQNFDQILPESGDYRLEVSSPAGTAPTTFTLSVAVTGGQPAPTVPPQPSAQRISFASGSNSAQVNAQTGGNTINYYLLAAGAGQFMQVAVTSPNNNVYLSVVAPSGIMLASAPAGARSFSGALTENGDYTFRVSTTPGGAQTAYTLNVSVTGAPPPPTQAPLPTQPGQPTLAPPPGTQRIRFAAGATSAAVAGQIAGGTVVNYVLGASSGQHMTISLDSPGSNIYLSVISPTGVYLTHAELGERSLDHILSESGDYTLQVTSPGGTPQSGYTLAVSITS